MGEVADSTGDTATTNGTAKHEVKTPFLIGVSGGTASGKVIIFNLNLQMLASNVCRLITYFVNTIFSQLFVNVSWSNWVRLTWIIHKDRLLCFSIFK